MTLVVSHVSTFSFLSSDKDVVSHPNTQIPFWEMRKDYNQVSQPTRQPPKKPLTKCHRKSPHLCSNHPTTAPSTFGSAHMTASHHQISTLRRGLDHLRCIFNKSAVAGEWPFCWQVNMEIEVSSLVPYPCSFNILSLIF